MILAISDVLFVHANIHAHVTSSHFISGLTKSRHHHRYRCRTRTAGTSPG
jgi:hypothetical protein